MNRVIIGIDPGATGGIIIGNSGVPEVLSMPETEHDMVDIIRKVAQSPFDKVAVIEKVSGFAGGEGNPGSAMFNFGRSVGVLYGALIAFEIRIEEVTPQKWQKALSLGTREHARSSPGASPEEKKRIRALNARYKTEWKNKLKAEAQRLFPSVKVTLKTADALLIYEYARRFSISNF